MTESYLKSAVVVNYTQATGRGIIIQTKFQSNCNFIFLVNINLPVYELYHYIYNQILKYESASIQYMTTAHSIHMVFRKTFVTLYDKLGKCRQI